MMRILRADQTDLADALSALSAKLGFSRGMSSPDADERTLAVFGEPLSPLEAVRRILSEVRENGDKAVVAYTRKLDGATLTAETLRVPKEEMARAYQQIPDRLRKALGRAKANIWAFQEHIKVHAPPPIRNPEGGLLSVQYRPLKRVGIFVPGGKAGYPSSVLMTAIPAQAAGVEEVAMVTPCLPDGSVRLETLAAAHEVGIAELYRGAAVALIGALAYGTRTIPRVDKIVGPGNLFVTLAKREVYGEVDLDMLAGPSEVLIIADKTADPRFIAADLLSQAEHDPAAAVLLTSDEKIAAQTAEEVERQLGLLSRGEAARRCIDEYGLIAVTHDLDQAIALANRFAPEHLELALAEPKHALAQVRSAGAVFVGMHTPEPVGDYLAGPSHVLPTGGTARFFSGLSVNDFLRRHSVMVYSEEALRKSVDAIDAIARAEGLDAHARSATIRFQHE